MGLFQFFKNRTTETIAKDSCSCRSCAGEITKGEKILWGAQGPYHLSCAPGSDGRPVVYEQKLKNIQCNHSPVPVTVLGGYGFDLQKSETLALLCGNDRLHLQNFQTKKLVVILFTELTSLEVSGPGTESKNAGVIGGGFGFQGAVEGVLIATTINALTSRSTTNTFLHLVSLNAEVMLHTSTIEPSELRLLLSPAFVRKTQATPVTDPALNSLGAEIERLHGLKQKGILTDEEFVSAKARLIKN